ncbi:hypothetical protein [Legionella jamestowniensis]|uniref:Acetyltransferase n=1 Tax=Legionella jamestowniensis TaxID=455 RepID=A0A0W0UJI2_9GAMM|nr:hypothetical protein [Legionella jamestowniensis]KTD07884.1 acetyltransferase [Legionella jamestowniensis]SFL63624.1 hypothetical protein SAMN02746073_1204 [Legionella jamestowniensis DSM 19215]
MSKFLIFLIFLMSWAFVPNALARQSGGGGEDLKGVCELAGGRWVGSESSNWACCWDNWGCYGCVNGACKMKCDTQRCRQANGMARPSSDDEVIIKGLAPANSKAPIVPKKVIIKNPSPKTLQKTQ